MNEQTLALEAIGRLSQGLTFARYAKPEGPEYRVLQVGNLDSIHVRTHEGDRLEHLDEEKVKSAIIQPGQILLALRASSLKAAVVPEGFPPAVASNSLTVLEVDGTVADPYFMAAVLGSEAMQYKVARLTTGTVIQSISVAQLRKVELRVPPLSQQQAFSSAVRALSDYQAALEAESKLRTEELDLLLRPFILEDDR